MWIFNSLFGKIFVVLFWPFLNMNPWIGMFLVSFLTGLLMLFIYKHTSNQEGLRKVKNKIKAHLLELRLFKDNLSVSLRAQGNILRTNLKYIGYSLKPLLVMIIPVVLILIQLNFWFAYDSLQSGQDTILRVKLGEGIPLLDTEVEIKTDSGILLETPPLRIEESSEINWRIRANKDGIHRISIWVEGQDYTKTVSVGQKTLSRISPLRTRKNFLKELFYPTESPLPKEGPVETIEITYPPRNLALFGGHIHWLIVYFLLSIIIGFSLKGFFKVEI